MDQPQDNARRSTYHHGDLRDALLKAAEAELIDKGIEGFSLRGVAKRAGVSHAAPAHHFRDTSAMLTALATIAARRLSKTMKMAHDRAAPDPRARFVASGIGYVEFALENPALFKLLFGSERPDSDDANLVAAATEAFRMLEADIAAVRGAEPMQSDGGLLDVGSSWAMAHGIASLLVAGRAQFLKPLLERDRYATLAAIVGRALPEPNERSDC